jgi:hypothetical protein
VSKLVDLLISLLQQANTEEKEREKLKIREEGLAKDLQKFYKGQLVVSQLSSGILKDNEIEVLKAACEKELSNNHRACLRVLDEFIEFCMLFSQPEKRIKKPSGQYIEKQVNTRQVVDMENEMSQELMKLNTGIAYARVIQNKEAG